MSTRLNLLDDTDHGLRAYVDIMVEPKLHAKY